jgi:hypothetical protein
MTTYQTQTRWTQEEDEQLRELAKAGKSASEISKAMARSLKPVRHRAALLSIAIATLRP